MLTPRAVALLNDVASKIDQVRRLERELTAVVAEAKREGASWRQLAEALGMTHQAAHQRFAKHVGDAP